MLRPRLPFLAATGSSSSARLPSSPSSLDEEASDEPSSSSDISAFSYSLETFNAKAPAPASSYKISFKGEIYNRSGDIEDLFKEFDDLTAEVKKSFWARTFACCNGKTEKN